MEAVALISTAKDVISGCIKCLRFVRESFRIGQAATKLQIRVQSCQVRLAAWVMVSGWAGSDSGTGSEGRSFIDANEDMILVVLSGIARSYEKIQAVARHYQIPLSLPDFRDLVADEGVVGASGVDEVAPLRDHLTLAQIRGALTARENEMQRKIPAADVKRYTFVARDAAKLAKLVDEISGAITVLEKLLDTNRRVQYTALFKVDDYEKLKDKSISELLALKREANDAGDQRLESAANVTIATQDAALELAHHERASQGLEASSAFKSLLRHRIDVTDERDRFGRAIGLVHFPEERWYALVEFREKRHEDGSDKTAQDDVDYLCNMLSTDTRNRPDQLRTLQCLGHQDHESFRDQFLLVHALPLRTTIEITTPPSLYDVLNSRSHEATPLEDRLSLAVGIARSVQLFLSFGWFHKGIRSSNIIFFKDDASLANQPSLLSAAAATPPSTAVLQSLGDYYIVGFDNGRRESSAHLTNTRARPDRLLDLYRPPAFEGGVTSDGKGYRAQYDLYSLGVVLCEIAQWASVDTGRFINQSHLAQHRLRPSELAKVFTQGGDDRFWAFSPLKGMGHRMGTFYLEAVRACFAAGERAASVTWVLDQIVGPLEKAVMSGSLATEI